MPLIRQMDIKDLKTHPEEHVKPLELADYWGVHEHTVYRWIDKGALPAKRIGRSLRITRDDALRFERIDGQATE